MDSHRVVLSQQAIDTKVIFNRDDFTYIETLGAGEFGSVDLYEYRGLDPTILGLCDAANRVVIKLPHRDKPVDIGELNIAAHVYNTTKKNGRVVRDQVTKIPPMRYMLGVPLFDGDKPIGLLCNYIKNSNVQSAAYVNAEAYIKDIFDATKFHANVASRSDVAIILAQLAFFLRAAVDELQSVRVFHNDLKWKNLMVNIPIEKRGRFVSPTLSLVDYGMSVIIPESGEIIWPSQKYPLLGVDLNFLKTGYCSYATDIYSVKSLIIALVAHALLKANANRVIYFKEPKPNGECQSEVEIKDHKLNNTESDEDALNVFFLNAMRIINNYNVDRDIQAILQIFYNCYRKPLTEMPKVNLPHASPIERGEALREKDMKWYLEANGKFMERVISNRLAGLGKDKKSYRKKFDLFNDIQKLKEFQFTEEFMQTDFYKRIDKITTMADLNEYLEELKKSAEESMTASGAKSPRREIGRDIDLAGKRDTDYTPLKVDDTDSSSSLDEDRDFRIAKQSASSQPPVTSPKRRRRHDRVATEFRPMPARPQTESTTEEPVSPRSHAPRPTSPRKDDVRHAEANESEIKEARVEDDESLEIERIDAATATTATTATTSTATTATTSTATTDKAAPPRVTRLRLFEIRPEVSTPPVASPRKSSHAYNEEGEDLQENPGNISPSGKVAKKVKSPRKGEVDAGKESPVASPRKSPHVYKEEAEAQQENPGNISPSAKSDKGSKKSPRNKRLSDVSSKGAVSPRSHSPLDKRASEKDGKEGGSPRGNNSPRDESPSTKRSKEAINQSDQSNKETTSPRGKSSRPK